MQWGWQRHHACRLCGAVMQVETVDYTAPDGHGRFVTYHRVRHYFCPNGCTTGFYDFRRARVDAGPAHGPASGAPAPRPARAGRRALGFLVRGYTAVGLLLLYALFMYAVGVMAMPAAARVGLWLVITGAFAGIGALLVLPPRTAPAASRVAQEQAARAAGVAGRQPAGAAPQAEPARPEQARAAGGRRPVAATARKPGSDVGA
ncbi:MAG: hypothetical protein IMX02_00845 [Limnochordaceae bacterium]|nr:hypothetical protein [Limnochordaceae bacterium]